MDCNKSQNNRVEDCKIVQFNEAINISTSIFEFCCEILWRNGHLQYLMRGGMSKTLTYPKISVNHLKFRTISLLRTTNVWNQIIKQICINLVRFMWNKWKMYYWLYLNVIWTFKKSVGYTKRMFYNNTCKLLKITKIMGLLSEEVLEFPVINLQILFVLMFWNKMC